jgi:hypothetical protein
MGPRSPAQGPPPGWAPPRQAPRPGPRPQRSQRPPEHRNIGGILIAVVLTLTVLAAGWYFVIRGSAPTSTFISANERFVHAMHASLDAPATVQRFNELPELRRTLQKNFDEMERDWRIFNRLAEREDGEAGQIAREARAAARLALTHGYAWADAVVHTRELINAQTETSQISVYISILERLRNEWAALSK